MYKIFGFLISFLIIPGCLFSQVQSDYNPMNIGNYWIQHTNTLFDGYNPTTFRMEIEGIDLINGIEYFRMKQEQTVDDGSKKPSVWYIWTGQNSKGGLLGAFGTSSDIDSAFIYDPPVVSFPKDANSIGYSWKYFMPGTGNGGQNFSNEIISYTETVKVPSGAYKNCMKISTIITDTSGTTTQTYNHYYAQGVGQILNEGWSSWGGDYKFELTEYNVQTSVIVGKSLNNPDNFKLCRNYPNPFNPKTVIQYQIPNSTNVSLKVYNVLGKEIATLVDQYQSFGNHSIKFDATNLPSGIYFYKLRTAGYLETKKMLLCR